MPTKTARTKKQENRIIVKEPPQAQYSSILIAILGGLYTCTHHLRPEAETTVYDLQSAACHLKEGGFVIDLSSCKMREDIFPIAMAAPEENGTIEYSEATLDLSRLRTEPEAYWQDFQQLAPKIVADVRPQEYFSSQKASAAIVALYYAGHGVRVGRRVDNVIMWSDGTQDEILPQA